MESGIWFIFFSILQMWYVEVGIAESPLDFEITSPLYIISMQT